MLASVPGLPRSVGVFNMRMRKTFEVSLGVRIMKTRTERGRPGTEAIVLCYILESVVSAYNLLISIIMCNDKNIYEPPDQSCGFIMDLLFCHSPTILLQTVIIY